MGIFLFTILCFKSARRSARVAAEGVQFLRISSIRVAERKEGGSKTFPGRGSRRPCPKWNSPRLLHVLHIFHCVQYFDPSCTFLPCVQFTYQIMMLLARPSGCNLASLPVFKEGEGEGQVIWAMPERKPVFIMGYLPLDLSSSFVKSLDGGDNSVLFKIFIHCSLLNIIHVFIQPGSREAAGRLGGDLI